MVAEKTSNDGILKNAPLKEVIFDLHWNLDYNKEQNIYLDDEFETAVIKFLSLTAEKNFDTFELLTHSSVPKTLLANKVTHRIKKRDEKFPIFQIGPGVLTVNDNNKNYSWKDYFELIQIAVECLSNSYKKKLVIEKIGLRYIDSVKVNVFEKEDKFSFLKKHLNVNPENYSFVDGELKDINFAKEFIVNGYEDISLNLTIATGVDKLNGEDIIVWQTYLKSKRSLKIEILNNWLEKAHQLASITFKKMISNELYNHFSR